MKQRKMLISRIVECVGPVSAVVFGWGMSANNIPIIVGGSFLLLFALLLAVRIVGGKTKSPSRLPLTVGISLGFCMIVGGALLRAEIIARTGVILWFVSVFAVWAIIWGVGSSHD